MLAESDTKPVHALAASSLASGSASSGFPIVLTAPLTEVIDHAGYFIQMSMASLPIRMEGILNRKYPGWKTLERNADGTARYVPAGLRVLEASLLRRYPATDLACCYPMDLPRFLGPQTRVVAVSTHNPIGVTFAAGVYTSIFGSATQPINSHYAREMFETLKSSPYRPLFKLIVGGSGGWQIVQMDAWEDLGVDCVVEGRSESTDIFELFDRALRGQDIPRGVDRTRDLSRLQWQLLMKCWKMNLRPGQASWWAPTAWRVGALGLWAWRLRKLNGPQFTWPLLMFASVLPESLMVRIGKLYRGKALSIKTRRELLATIKPNQRQFIRPDTGDLPDDWNSDGHTGAVATPVAETSARHIRIAVTRV